MSFWNNLILQRNGKYPWRCSETTDQRSDCAVEWHKFSPGSLCSSPTAALLWILVVLKMKSARCTITRIDGEQLIHVLSLFKHRLFTVQNKDASQRSLIQTMNSVSVIHQLRRNFITFTYDLPIILYTMYVYTVYLCAQHIDSVWQDVEKLILRKNKLLRFLTFVVY